MPVMTDTMSFDKKWGRCVAYLQTHHYLYPSIFSVLRFKELFAPETAEATVFIMLQLFTGYTGQEITAEVDVVVSLSRDSSMRLINILLPLPVDWRYETILSCASKEQYLASPPHSFVFCVENF